MKTVGWIAFILVIIGAINWGLVGLFSWNILENIFGVGTTITQIIYILIGLGGVWLIFKGSKVMSKS